MKRYLSLLMGILGFVPILAQQSDYYYYYKGNRIDLTVDSTRLFVVSEGEFHPQTSTYTRTAEYTVISSTRSCIHNYVTPLQKQRSTSPMPEVYFSTLEIPEVLNASQYDDLVEKVKSEEAVRQVLPSFFVNGGHTDVTNNFYVKLKSPNDLVKIQEMAERYSIEIVGNDEYMPLLYVLSCNNSLSINAIEAANLFHSSSLFEYSEPEFSNFVKRHSDDFYYAEQWNLENTGLIGFQGVDINVEEAWEITKGSGIIVAVIDDGIYTSHPDLSANIYTKSYDAMTDSSPARLYDFHGTACAGVIGAVQNTIGVSGIAPECKLMPISFDSTATTLQMARAINWATQKKADVISNSWGSTSGFQAIDDAINIALTTGRNNKGCVVVFSSGNYGYGENEYVAYPANSNPDILAVGGINPLGERNVNGMIDYINHYSFSSSRYGAALDVVAPSELVYTTNYPYGNSLSNTYYLGDFHGTSAACPHVSGVAALILSVYPDLTTQQVAGIIEYTAKKVRPDIYTYQVDDIHINGTWNEEMGYGLLDAGAAVRIADKATRTTYVKDIEIWGAEHYYDYDVEVENTVVGAGGWLEINKYNTVLLKRNVRVENEGSLTIYKDPYEETEF